MGRLYIEFKFQPLLHKAQKKFLIQIKESLKFQEIESINRNISIKKVYKLIRHDVKFVSTRNVC